MYVIFISGGAHMISKIADWVATSFEALGIYILCIVVGLAKGGYRFFEK